MHREAWPLGCHLGAGMQNDPPWAVLQYGMKEIIGLGTWTLLGHIQP